MSLTAMWQPNNKRRHSSSCVIIATTRYNKGMATTMTWDNDEEGRGQWHGKDMRQQHTETTQDNTMPMQDNDGWSVCNTNDHPPPSPSNNDRTTMRVARAMHHSTRKLTRAHHHHHPETVWRGPLPPSTNNVTSAQPLHPWKTTSTQHHKWQTRAPHHQPLMATKAQHTTTDKQRRGPHTTSHEWQQRPHSISHKGPAPPAMRACLLLPLPL